MIVQNVQHFVPWSESKVRTGDSCLHEFQLGLIKSVIYLTQIRYISGQVPKTLFVIQILLLIPRGRPFHILYWRVGDSLCILINPQANPPPDYQMVIPLHSHILQELCCYSQKEECCWFSINVIPTFMKKSQVGTTFLTSASNEKCMPTTILVW